MTKVLGALPTGPEVVRTSVELAAPEALEPAAEETVFTTLAVVLGSTSPAADVVGSGDSPAAEVETTGSAAEVTGSGEATEVAVLEDATEAAAEEAGTGAATFTPHCPTGLLPGNCDKVPVMVSLIAESMLQEVEGSLSPPMRPGHLSIPESPASQLSMIC